MLAPTMSVTVSRGPEAVLVTGQNENPGWRATLRGKELATTTVDGWQQGFVVPAGEGGTVEISYPPGTTYRAALAVGVLAVLALLVLLLVDLRRPAPAVAVVEPAPVGRRLRRAGLGAGLVLLALLGGPVVAAAALAGSVLAGVLPTRAARLVAPSSAVLALAAAVVAAAAAGTMSGEPGTAADVLAALAAGLLLTVVVGGDDAQA